jgi:hypothetical protein
MLRALVSRRRFPYWCSRCDRETTHQCLRPSPITTIILVVITMGLYLLYVLWERISPSSAICTKCGTDNSNSWPTFDSHHPNDR